MSLFNRPIVCGFWLVMFLTSFALADEVRGPSLGEPVSPEELVGWDISIGPDGTGLPRGAGNSRIGFKVYQEHCFRCHGQRGAGGDGLADPLVGGIGSLNSAAPLKTVGSYWPYATTLFDYIRRAMPYDVPASLTNSEVYSVISYILAQNGIIGEIDEINAATLPLVKMPNQSGFVRYWPEPDLKR